MRRADRLGRLLALLRAERLDGLLVTSIPNIRYLTGFTGSAAHLAVAPRRTLLLTDSRYGLQASREAGRIRVRVVEAGGLPAAVGEWARAAGAGRLGFEADVLSWGAHRRVRRALPRGCALVPAAAPVERLRVVKDRGELRALRRAARIADRVMAAAAALLRPGMTEEAAAAAIERIARERGAEGTAFRPIVACGPAGAMPHHRPGPARLVPGRPIIVDLGVRVGGYNSDLTRTFILGRLTPRYREVFEAVREAQRAALQEIREGAEACRVDAAARAALAARGFGRSFGHALGHGVGLEVHEAPRIGGESAARLLEGMVCTVEPGVYLPGWGGVRIEDMVLVGPRGCAELTSSPKGITESVP
ncbi:MAG: Xaa-Pro peptidase family protein [bacterium]|nr:Xaa-Pro peptidase family protein [bacterium]